MALNLRKRASINYYESDEPSFDEYLYCDQCTDYVYEYCAIHTPLLVIPDDKVPVKNNMPSYVPRAALTIPHVFLHLAPSIVPGAGLGVFSTLTLPRGVRFGPYRGVRTQHVDSMYCWQIYDRHNKRSHVIDAADGNRSNWMRYVNCARHWKEQNLLAYQYRGQLYYRTIKTIPRFTELMVFYGSEYANALHINLSKYNSKIYYGEIISTSTAIYTSKALNKNIENEMQQDYLNADQFYLIDENCGENENNQNYTEESNSVQKNKIDYSTPTEINCNVDKIKLDFSNKTEKSRHVCEICRKTFATRKYLKEHSLSHLTTWKYNCEYCPFRSNYNYRFKNHVGRHTNTFQYSCQRCIYRTNYNRSFKIHCLRHDNNGDPVENNDSRCTSNPALKQCKICDFKTWSRKRLSTHNSQHKGNIYKCDLCYYSNHSKYNLSRHISSKH